MHRHPVFGFLVFAAPKGGNRLPSDLGWIVVGGSCVTGIIVSVILALREARNSRISVLLSMTSIP